MSFVSFRSYIQYVFTQDVQFQLIDKIKLYHYLKGNMMPSPEVYYYSNENCDIVDKIEYLLHRNIPFVVKPSHLSDKFLCFIIRDGCSVFDNKQVTSREIQNEVTKHIHSQVYGHVRPGIIIQENLDINGINEWKCLCVWGKVQLCEWRINHVKRNAYIDSNFGIYPMSDHSEKKMPPFKEDIYELAERISHNIPFLRVDILWNEAKYVVNELEISPGGFYGFYNEIKLMDLIKKGYDKENNRHTDILYEVKSYLSSLLYRSQVLVR
jgi:hypothetical protein